MKQAAKPNGQAKGATKQSILEQELLRLQEARGRLKDGNARYVERHPELRTLMDEFVSAAIAQKPNDIIKFGANWFASLREGQKGFCPLVLTGPSGSGMTTLFNMLLKRYPNVFVKPVQTTTRKAKDYEMHGEDFYFVSEFDFQTQADKGEFITWTPVQENFYGMSLEAMEKTVDSGKIGILDLPLDDLEAWRKSPLEIKFMFISPPSVDALEERLLGSQRYNPNAIEEKLDKAPDLIELGMNDPSFDCNITNDELEPSFAEVVYQLIGWYQDADIDPPPQISAPDAADAKSVVSNKSAKSKKSAGSKK